MVTENKKIVDDFDNFVSELKNSGLIKDKIKTKSGSKIFSGWNLDNCKVLFNKLVDKKYVGILNLSDIKKDNKVYVGLINKYKLLDKEFKGDYPSYDLSRILDNLCVENKLIGFYHYRNSDKNTNKSHKNIKNSVNSWIKVNYSNISKP